MEQLKPKNGLLLGVSAGGALWPTTAMPTTRLPCKHLDTRHSTWNSTSPRPVGADRNATHTFGEGWDNCELSAMRAADSKRFRCSSLIHRSHRVGSFQSPELAPPNIREIKGDVGDSTNCQTSSTATRKSCEETTTWTMPSMCANQRTTRALRMPVKVMAFAITSKLVKMRTCSDHASIESAHRRREAIGKKTQTKKLTQRMRPPTFAMSGNSGRLKARQNISRKKPQEESMQNQLSLRLRVNISMPCICMLIVAS
mmetsp:Transcript_24922/g.48557  ORF Transcript_24922/g.48557 Transcript_24922/m.48557 type:complete len:256 (+) Transcript_24922:744-1511(+)